MHQLSERSPLVRDRLSAGSPSSAPRQSNGANGIGAGSGVGVGVGVGVGGGAAASPPPTPAKTRLRKLHSAPIKDFLSTGTDMDSLRLSYAAKLVLAAVEGRHVESAVDLLLLKGGFVNPLSYTMYSPILVFIILGHLALALWEGGMDPFPMHSAVAAGEALFALCYAAHIFLNLWTFGVKQYRDKRWHFTFTVLAVSHSILMVFAALAPTRQDTSHTGPTAAGGGGAGGDGSVDGGWWNAPRLALLGAQTLRPMMLISNLKTIRRVFTNVLRTAKRTGNILMLGAVVLAVYSVLGINLFNSDQVKGYSNDGDNFDDFGSALLSLFVLVTEENFPMVADPSFTQRPLVAFPFFVSFLLLFLVFILPLLLGIVLDAYAHQHARQHERYRRKARNALLAAYFVLDDDGLEGLTRDQLVGVLTAEAGVGIDRRQAEQLWHVLVPDDEDEYGTSRSYSLPVAANRTDDYRTSKTPNLASPPAVDRNPTSNGIGSSSSYAARDAFQLARSRALSCPSGPPGGGGAAQWKRRMAGRDYRLDLHGFLHLADMLHVKAVESGGKDEGGDGGSGKGLCYLAGYDDEEDDGAVENGGETERDGDELGFWSVSGKWGRPCTGGAVRGGGVPGRGAGGLREESYEGEGDSDEGEQSDEEWRRQEDLQWCCLPGDEERGASAVAAGGRINGVRGDVNGSLSGGGEGGAQSPSFRFSHSRRQKMQRCARGLLQRARVAARSAVGRQWFCLASRSIAVLLAVLALTWTPRSQQRYDDCLSPWEEGYQSSVACDDGSGSDAPESVVDYRREDLLRRMEGGVLFAFLAEMVTKALALGFRGLWRLHWAHRFDLVILVACLSSYLFVGVPGNTRALFVDLHPALSDVVELPRAMAVMRLVTVFPQLRGLLETMATVAAMLMKIMVLYSCVSYSFATVGMAIFANARSDVLGPRYSFATLPEACMALFFLTVTNNWNDLLYPLVNSNRAGRWSAVYLVAYMLFCATMMLDVLTGVVIEGFRVSTKGPEQAQDEEQQQQQQQQLKSPGSVLQQPPPPPPPPPPARAATAGGKGSFPRSASDPGLDGGFTSSGNEDSSGSGSGVSGQRQQQGRRQGSRRRGLARKASQRKYTQVMAEDIFRPEAKVWRAQGVLDEEDVRQLDEAVKAVEGRLHQAWVSHVRDTGILGEPV
ncbi:unnamed protein product [Scytosiphon promiscuus]